MVPAVTPAHIKHTKGVKGCPLGLRVSEGLQMRGQRLLLADSESQAQEQEVRMQM